MERCILFYADVVIVGGGPIGLANAWGIKKLNPSLKVVVLEKYEQYQRKHTLVMQHQQLDKLMKATGTEQNAILCALLARLKKDAHIRTNELESIFKQLAIDCGVEIIIEEVVDKSVKIVVDELLDNGETVIQKVQKISNNQQLLRCNPKLIIGADGTHSVVSRTFFPEGNQIKHEFDYVLQLRYEIKGEEQAEAINSTAFYQQMARQGLVGNEYMGHFDDKTKTTPVTMQMMISKEDFEKLQAATSKNPILPFIKEKESISEQPIADLPPHIRNFINKYLIAKLKSCNLDGTKIDKNTVRISVNEAPATHARQVINEYNSVPVALAGDAGLGLSYFKGLNAGLESTAKFLSILSASIKNNFSNKKEMDNAFSQYRTWFLDEFAPKKIKEVAQYSTYQIRSAMKIMRVARSVKMSSMVEYDDDQKPIIDDYFAMLEQEPRAEKHWRWTPYPHREYEPVNLGQYEYVPLKHTLLKTKKIFIDYFKPYKSTFQRRQDFKQPLVGIVNVFIGTTKTLVGLITFDLRRSSDGVFSLLRGAIELATTPLSWFIKPITRGIASLIHGKVNIENNIGIKRLSQFGQECLEKQGQEEFSPVKTHELLAVCNDLHRKFNKAISRGQNSNIAQEEEEKIYNTVRVDKNAPRDAFNNYFTLFYKKSADESIDSFEKQRAIPVSK